MTEPLTPRERAEDAEEKYNVLLINDFNNLHPRALCDLIETAIIAAQAAERERLTASVDVEGLAEVLGHMLAEYRPAIEIARFVAEREAAIIEQAKLEARDACCREILSGKHEAGSPSWNDALECAAFAVGTMEPTDLSPPAPGKE